MRPGWRSSKKRSSNPSCASSIPTITSGNSPAGRYLLDDLWADTDCGHRVEKTVFLECRSEYREDGPEERRPSGETEFVAVLAATAARDEEHVVRVGAIVGHADLYNTAAQR